VQSIVQLETWSFLVVVVVVVVVVEGQGSILPLM